MSHVSVFAWFLLLLLCVFLLSLVISAGMLVAQWILPTFGFLTLLEAQNGSMYNSSIDRLWYPPTSNPINDLNTVIDGTGVYGFIFNGSYAPVSNDYYGGYDYCNMPHVNKVQYLRPSDNYTLEYVEVIHRHHKRTPYAANTLPQESYSWDCDDEGLLYYGKPLNPTGNGSASTYWSVYTSSSNPFPPQGFNGTCQSPQITKGGLDDSWQHGKDLYEVYHDLLSFLPDEPGNQISYRVTNNLITSQVAGMVINAMYNPPTDFPLSIQPASIDSLEPAYTCPSATALYNTYAVGSTNPNWTAHLTASQPLYATLDSISGVSPTNPGFHQSWDHYFDNLSSRLCNTKPLPCNISNPTLCITPSLATSVFRLGLYEYDYIYRSSPHSLSYSTASYGVFIAELAQNIRSRLVGGPIKYTHNIAHDGSIALLLSILQIDKMVWPGLGAELVFEVYKTKNNNDNDGDGIGIEAQMQMRFVRILWGGEVLRSSYPGLGEVDMIPLDSLLGYFDELVGVGARKVPGLCNKPLAAAASENGVVGKEEGGLDFCVDC